MHIRGPNGHFLVKMSCRPCLLPDAETKDTRCLYIPVQSNTVLPTVAHYLFFLRTHLRYTY